MDMFVCIENNTVISILDYAPSVPESVQVISITKEEYNSIESGTHFFNTLTKKVELQSSTILNSIEQEKINSKNRSFLESTDWKILRHIREKALNMQTKMSEEEYLKLETERQSAADSIK